MQKPKPYRAPIRRRSATALPPRRLRRGVGSVEDHDLEIIFDWEEPSSTQH